MPKRCGYTLLEVMLAIAIGLLIVAALYIALDVQMRYMQSGRNAAAEGQLARGLLARMAADIRLSLATLPPPATAAGNTASSPPAASPTTTPSTTSADSTSETGAASTSSSLGATQFNYGLTGDDYELTLYVTSVPRYGRLDADVQTGLCDMRRITYAVMPGVGLMRQEVRMIASADADATPPDLVAHEVVDLQFRYYDGSSQTWVTTWDGTTSGPPLAVEISLALDPPIDPFLPRSMLRPPTYYRLVVAIAGATIPDSSSTGQTTAAP